MLFSAGPITGRNRTVRYPGEHHNGTTAARNLKEVDVTSAQAASLRDALQALMDAIANREPIADHLHHLATLHRQLAPFTSRQLDHFLQNRSYTKALEYLRHGVVIEDPERPDCDDT